MKNVDNYSFNKKYGFKQNPRTIITAFLLKSIFLKKLYKFRAK